MKSLIKQFYVFSMGGGIYFIIELIYRGYSHPFMFVIGGFCVLFLYKINYWLSDKSVILKAFLGSIAISMTEFISGCILNVWFDMNIWNYSNLPLNIFGQISLLFSFYWFLLCIPAIFLLNKIKTV